MKTVKQIIITTIGVLGLCGLTSLSVRATTAIASAKQHPIEASDGDGETDDDVQSAEESARLQALATVTPQQAQQAAEQHMGKPADKVEIENDGGSLVYAVSFGQQDVKIDAGNGQVLYTDNQNDGENDRVHPKSSIQLSETDRGDGDGETNDDG
jgi:uncharacterized membrane protein YkoI